MYAKKPVQPDLSEDIEIETKVGYTYKELVLYHFKRVTTHSCVEFRGGFYTTIENRDGSTIQIYTPDTREVFSNAVLSLAILLRPKFDDEINNKFKEYSQKLKALEEGFLEKSSPNETIILSERFYDNIKDKILLEEFKNHKLLLHIKLFAELSKHLGRLNFFESMGGDF